MSKVHIFIQYDCDVVHVTVPNMECIDLYPGSEAHLTFSIYEKEKEKK